VTADRPKEDDGMERRVPLQAMRQRIRDGQARPLLDSSAPPVRYADRWWAIPATAAEEVYEPVTDPAQLRVLDDAAARLAAAEAAGRDDGGGEGGER
jgi:hypothetical protein